MFLVLLRVPPTHLAGNVATNAGGGALVFVSADNGAVSLNESIFSSNTAGEGIAFPCVESLMSIWLLWNFRVSRRWSVRPDGGSRCG